MKQIFRQWFGPKRPPARAASPAPNDSAHDNPVTIEDGSDYAMRRQLVLVLLRDLLRRSGISPEWIEGQVLVVSSRSRGDGMFLRLTIKQWDARLLTYAWALQNTLAAEILRFEPASAKWLHGISWQFDLSGCPYPDLPEPQFWTAVPATTSGMAASAPATGEAGSEEELRQDLQRMFAIRDAELQRDSQGSGLSENAYVKTEPASL